MEKPAVIDEEYIFEGRSIISETNLKGEITFANRKFCEISGYTKQELIGKPHNIIRHPDMPKAAFEGMWNDLNLGKHWHGFVKNLRKDGLYYWVETHISPVYDENDRIKGYIAARSVPDRKNIDQISAEYKKLLAKEQ